MKDLLTEEQANKELTKLFTSDYSGDLMDYSPNDTIKIIITWLIKKGYIKKTALEEAKKLRESLLKRDGVKVMSEKWFLLRKFDNMANLYEQAIKEELDIRFELNNKILELSEKIGKCHCDSLIPELGSKPSIQISKGYKEEIKESILERG